MKSLESNYSDLIRTEEIGKTIQNRTMLVIKLGYAPRNNKTKRAFWFDAGIHAREWTTISTAMYSIKQV